MPQRVPKKTRKAGDPTLSRRLEDLVEYARARGASDAKIISSSEIVLDPRVRFKCMIPKCFASGTCSHCPPNGYSLETVSRIVSQYESAVFFRVLVDPEIIAGPKVSESLNSGLLDDTGTLVNLGAHYMLVFQIVALLEKKARQFGFSPTGFAAGTCRDVLCHFQPYCQALMTSRGCRHPDLSRPSMESCGMNAYTMAARAGWDVYPIGGTCRPHLVPHGSLMGLVLIA